MTNLIGDELVARKRDTFEPDYSKKNPSPWDPENRNPWNPDKHPTQYRYIARLIKELDALNIRPAKYPPEIKVRVYELRDQGQTLRQIAEEVKISKSTACLYLQKRPKSPSKETYEITQLGTEKVVEREVTIREVSLGKIKPSGPVKTNDQNS